MCKITVCTDYSKTVYTVKTDDEAIKIQGKLKQKIKLLCGNKKSQHTCTDSVNKNLKLLYHRKVLADDIFS